MDMDDECEHLKREGSDSAVIRIKCVEAKKSFKAIKSMKRELGKTGIKLNPLGLGCMGMVDGVYGVSDDVESYKVLDRALEVGCTFWDTADLYGFGQNEQFLSKVLKDHRDDIFICTKFGYTANGICGTPQYVREACENSLSRLGVDTIDLYYQHRVDKNTPIEDTVKAMAELVKEGKVRFIGLSECSAQTLRRAYKVHPITAVQIEYSPWCLDIEKNGLLDAARELGVTIVAYSPLGRGFLTGNIKAHDDLPENDFRRAVPRFSKENFDKNLQLVSGIKTLATKKGLTPSELTLAWVLGRHPDIFVIPGTKKIKYFNQNWNGGQIKLTDEEMAEINALVETAEPQGDRYMESQMRLLEG